MKQTARILLITALLAVGIVFAQTWTTITAQTTSTAAGETTTTAAAAPAKERRTPGEPYLILLTVTDADGQPLVITEGDPPTTATLTARLYDGSGAAPTAPYDIYLQAVVNHDIEVTDIYNLAEDQQGQVLIDDSAAAATTRYKAVASFVIPAGASSGSVDVTVLAHDKGFTVDSQIFRRYGFGLYENYSYEVTLVDPSIEVPPTRWNSLDSLCRNAWREGAVSGDEPFWTRDIDVSRFADDCVFEGVDGRTYGLADIPAGGGNYSSQWMVLPRQNHPGSGWDWAGTQYQPIAGNAFFTVVDNDMVPDADADALRLEFAPSEHDLLTQAARSRAAWWIVKATNLPAGFGDAYTGPLVSFGSGYARLFDVDRFARTVPADGSSLCDGHRPAGDCAVFYLAMSSLPAPEHLRCIPECIVSVRNVSFPNGKPAAAPPPAATTTTTTTTTTVVPQVIEQPPAPEPPAVPGGEPPAEAETTTTTLPEAESPPPTTTTTTSAAPPPTTTTTAALSSPAATYPSTVQQDGLTVYQGQADAVQADGKPFYTLLRPAASGSLFTWGIPYRMGEARLYEDQLCVWTAPRLDGLPGAVLIIWQDGADVPAVVLAAADGQPAAEGDCPGAAPDGEAIYWNSPPVVPPLTGEWQLTVKVPV